MSQPKTAWQPPDEKWKNNLWQQCQHALAPRFTDLTSKHAAALSGLDDDDVDRRGALDSEHEDALRALTVEREQLYATHLQAEILQRRYLANKDDLSPAELAAFKRYQQEFFDSVTSKGSTDRERTRSNESQPSGPISATAIVRSSSGGTSSAGSAPRESAAGVLLRPFGVTEAAEANRRRNNSVASSSSLESSIWPASRKRTSSNSVGSGATGVIRIPDGQFDQERWTPLTPPDEPIGRASRPSPSLIQDLESTNPGWPSGKGRAWRQSVSPGPGRSQASRTLAAAMVEPKMEVIVPADTFPADTPPFEGPSASEPEETLSDTPIADVENSSASDLRRGKRPSRPPKSRTTSRTAPGSPSMLSPSLLSPPQPSASQGVTLVEARGTPTGSPTPFQPIDLAPSTYPASSRAPPRTSDVASNGRKTSTGSMRRHRPGELGLMEMPSTISPPSISSVAPPPPPASTAPSSGLFMSGVMGPPQLPPSNQQPLSQAASSSVAINGRRSVINAVPVSAPALATSFTSSITIPGVGTSPAGASPPVQQPLDGRRTSISSSSPSSAGWHGPSSLDTSKRASRRGSGPLTNSDDLNGQHIHRKRSANLRNEHDEDIQPSLRSARTRWKTEPIPENGQLELTSDANPRDRDNGSSQSRHGSIRSRSSREYLRNFGADLYTSDPPRHSQTGLHDISDDEYPSETRSRSSQRSASDIRTREERVKSREDAVKAREDRLEAARSDLAKREADMMTMEAEIRRREKVVAAQVKEAERQAVEIAKKEEGLLQMEEDVKRRLEDAQRKIERADLALQELERRAEGVRQWEQALGRREADAARREGEQREEGWSPTPSEDWDYQHRPRQAELEKPRHPPRESEMDDEPAREDLEQHGHVADESLIDDEPLLSPPAQFPTASVHRLKTQLSTFEALLEPITPIDRGLTDTPLADDEGSPGLKHRGTLSSRKRDDKHNRAIEKQRQLREADERRRAEQLRLEEGTRLEETQRLQVEEERHRPEAENAGIPNEEERAHMDEEAHADEDFEHEEAVHELDDGAIAHDDDVDFEDHVPEEDMQFQEATVEDARMQATLRLQEQLRWEEHLRQQQREEQLKEDERLAKQLMEEQERERQVQLELQRQQRHMEALRRAEEEEQARQVGFRMAQEAEDQRRAEEQARQVAAAAERKRREQQQQQQREEDERRREEWARRQRLANSQVPPSTSMPASVAQPIPGPTNAIPIPTDRSTSSSSAWSAGGGTAAGWSTSTRTASTSMSNSARPSGPAAGTSPGSGPSIHRVPGASGYSPGTGSHGSNATRGAPLSEAEWARRQAEQAQKQQEQFKREQERAAERSNIVPRSFTKEDLIMLFQKHEQQWELIREAHKIRWDTLPWPVFRRPSGPEDLTTDAVGRYVLSEYYPTDKSWKDRIKEHMRRWHPDRFETQLLPKVNEEERELVKEGAGWVVRALNELLTRANAPKFD